MIIHPYTEIAVLSYARATDDAQWFIDFLSDNKITVEPNSVLAQAIDIMQKLIVWQKDESQVPTILDTKGVMSKAIGSWYLICCIREASKHPRFDGVIRLLPQLASENPIMTMADKSSMPRNLSFELETGCLFLASGIEAQSKPEPDLIVNYSQENWNIACKMIYSLNPVTLGDNIEKGIDQSLREDGYGMVFLGISNRIDHDTFMPILDSKNEVMGSFRNKIYAEKLLGTTFQKIFNEVKEQGKTRFDALIREPRFRGIGLIAHTTCAIGKTFSILSGVGLLRRDDFGLPYFEGPEIRLMKTINDTAQTVITR